MADAIEFYKKAFNAEELIRLEGPEGRLIHACIRIGDSAVMLADESPDWGSFGPKSLKGSPVTIHLLTGRRIHDASRHLEDRGQQYPDV